jgi:hypothetical protein
MKSTLLATSLAISGLLTACGDAGDDAQTEPIPEPVLTDDAKADVVDRVAMRGDLAFGATVDGAFTEDLQFDAWRLVAKGGARVSLEVTQAGTARSLDSVLFVYGPKEASGYGTAALARDDDSGWGPHPRLRDLVLPKTGEYLVVLGTRDGQGRGKFRLAATCPGGDCTAPVLPLPTTCPPAVATGLIDCAAEQTTDTSVPLAMRPRPEEALDTCLDAEGFAGPWDAACAASPLDACALPYEDAWRGVSAVCREALAPTIRRDTCAFGDTWRGVYRTPGIAVTRERTARQLSHMSAVEKRQVVAAMVAAGHTDIHSASAALERADSNEIHLVDLWDESHGAPFLGVEFGAGDTSVGAIFRVGSTAVVVRNGDGDLYDCALPPGPRGRVCLDTPDCEAGLTCQGKAEGVGAGRCVSQGPRPGAGEPCSLSTSCGTDTGLVCSGLTRSPQNGLCQPAWMQNTFFTAPGTALTLAPGGGALVVPVEVRGLATVDMDVWLHLLVTPQTGTGMTITLTNPAGAVVTVLEGRVGPDQLWLQSPVQGFSGDETVNGTWTLSITDQNGVGLTVDALSLTLGSRWD